MNFNVCRLLSPFSLDVRQRTVDAHNNQEENLVIQGYIWTILLYGSHIHAHSHNYSDKHRNPVFMHFLSNFIFFALLFTLASSDLSRVDIKMMQTLEINM